MRTNFIFSSLLFDCEPMVIFSLKVQKPMVLTKYKCEIFNSLILFKKRQNTRLLTFILLNLFFFDNFIVTLQALSVN